MQTALSPEQQRLLTGMHRDPFAILGRHMKDGSWHITAMLPKARQVQVVIGELSKPMARISDSPLFTFNTRSTALPHYHLLWTENGIDWQEEDDPYCFAPTIGDLDMYLFSVGRHVHLYRILGAHCMKHQGVQGVRFAVWAPNAQRVSVVGDFNQWHGLRHPMRVRGGSGIWELFIPGNFARNHYKFEIIDQHGALRLKTDPFGNAFEVRPQTAAIVCPPVNYAWRDRDWLERRRNWQWQEAPMSVYEVHLASWRRNEHGAELSYREIAKPLAEHVLKLGFTHIELLPITEYPLDDSWGYQVTGYFAPSSRFGTPDDFRFFVGYMHQQGIGVILDWVPAHFPRDDYALARYDGSALYEHDDPRLGEHRDWGTLIFNYGRAEVRNFLLASANYWLEEFHIDGLRVDAVASMLYLDYSREDGEWQPNRYGGRENLEAVEFLRELNTLTHGRHPGTVTIAEESTAWPLVTSPVSHDGLGFSMKWNMGWMHDTLNYMSQDSLFRSHHHNQLTFGLMYAFSENFMLPLSHDEVVHGKASLLGKMAGDPWQKRANLRLLYSYMFTYPGTKLLFMGAEMGQKQEWQFRNQLPWDLLDNPEHAGIANLIADLNRLYRNHPELYKGDFDGSGFEWIDCDNAAQSLLIYRRMHAGGSVIVALNFTPQVHQNFRLGVPEAGTYEELLNSDEQHYGGSGVSSGKRHASQPLAWMQQTHSINLSLPPLGAIVLKKI